MPPPTPTRCARDLSEWLDDPLATSPPWLDDPLAVHPLGRRGAVVAAIYLGSYAAPWAASWGVARASGSWLLRDAPVGPLALARDLATELRHSSLRLDDLHSATLVEALAEAEYLAEEARADWRDVPDTDPAHAALLEAMRRAQMTATRYRMPDVDPWSLTASARLLEASADALVVTGAYRRDLLAAMREAMPRSTVTDRPAADADAVVEALATSTPLGDLVKRSTVRDALRDADVDLRGLDVDALCARHGLPRPNRCGQIGGIYVYRRTDSGGSHHDR